MRRFSAILLLLAGCGSAGSRQPAVDPGVSNAMELGRSAFDLHEPSEAASQYETAYGRALLSDDVAAIHDAAYNLATARLAGDDPQAAIDVLTRARGDLALRGDSRLADLDVVEAAARLRLGQPDRALALASPHFGAQEQLGERAAFIAGLAASALSRDDALHAAQARVGEGPKLSPTAQADRDELAGLAALAAGDGPHALDLAVAVSAQRRNLEDYRGMARALHQAARAAQAAGKPDLAAAYARIAAQSDAEQQPHAGGALKAASAVTVPNRQDR